MNKLTDDARDMAIAFKGVCGKNGIPILVYSTYRSLEEQAKLFRQGRSWGDIQKKITHFRENGLEELGDIIIKAGPQKGPLVTNAGPGESWHQHRVAFDFVPLRSGKPVWKTTGQEAGLWTRVGSFGEEVGLTWAGRWKHFKEFAHMQVPKASKPSLDVLRTLIKVPVKVIPSSTLKYRMALEVYANPDNWGKSWLGKGVWYGPEPPMKTARKALDEGRG